MRIINTIAVLSMGAMLLLTACGGTSSGSPQATTPETTPPEAMNMTPAPAQTATAASFATSNLTVSPNKAMAGERVMVGVTVTNTGTQQGTYSVVVKDHDGKLLGTKDVTLAGGAKEEVTLHISINTTGTHMVMVDKLYRNLMIQDTTATMPTMPTMPMMPPAQNTTPPPTQPTPAGTTGGFAVSALVLEPSMPEVGDDIIVSFKVTNNSGKAGTYHAEVKIDGTVAAAQDVTLGVGETQVVNIGLKAPIKEGTYTFSVGDQSIKEHIMAAM